MPAAVVVVAKVLQYKQQFKICKCLLKNQEAFFIN